MESFPKKIIGAYALLFNDKNQVLLVKNVDDIWILIDIGSNNQVYR